MATDFKQYDSRWGSKSYSGGTMSGCGCGPTAVADIANELDSSVLPPAVADWLTSHGFAGTNGGGTIRYGITHALEAYGLTEVEGCRTYAEDQKGTNDPSMKHFCELMCDGEHRGVILFSGGTKGGVTWTKGGHFICCDGGKQNGSDYLLHMCDSGQRENDGWYSYSKTMAGLCYRAYIGKIPSKEKKKYEGKLPSTTISVSTDRADDLATFAESMCWAYGTPEKKWKYSTGAPTTKTKAVMNKRGYNSKVNLSDCGYTQNAIIYSVLGKKVTVLGGVKESFKKVDGFNIVKDSTSISTSDVKRGDIIRYKKTNGTSQHTLMYLGNGKIAEGGRKVRFAVIRKSTKYTGKKKKVQILRAIEGTTTRAYIDRECYGGKENGKLLQAYLNFYDSTNNLVVDGIWGDCTQKAVLKMQTDFFGADEADGKIGAKTLQKMAEVER